MSSWRSGRVTSRIAFSKSIRLIPIAAPAPSAAAATIASQRRRRDLRRRRARRRGLRTAGGGPRRAHAAPGASAASSGISRATRSLQLAPASRRSRSRASRAPAFSSWVSWRPLRPSSSSRPAARRARAARSARRPRRTRSRRSALHPGLEQQRHLHHRERGLGRQRPRATRRPARRPAGEAPTPATRARRGARRRSPPTGRAVHLAVGAAPPRPSARPAVAHLVAVPSSSWTTASVDSVAAPSRSKAARASDLPAPIPPVRPMKQQEPRPRAGSSGRCQAVGPPPARSGALGLRGAGSSVSSAAGLLPPSAGGGLGEDLLGEVEVGHLLRRRLGASPVSSGGIRSRSGRSWPSARLTLSEIRRRSSSISRILTQTSSPG